jgi:UDP-N-Acetylglucosamine 2-epimerase (EC 5.1.3.14)
MRMLKGKNNIHLLAPLDYETFVYILKQCCFVLSDSGGVQEEAPAFGKPILVMREVTERQEGVEAGIAKLIGMDTERIVQEAKTLLSSPRAYEKMACSVNPYGDGRAAERIVKAITKHYKL